MPTEAIVRPFVGEDITPTKYTAPGATSHPPVVLYVGLKGGTKTFPWAEASSQSTYMAAVHREKASDNIDLTE